MLNEWLKKIDEIIQRLSMFVQIQTQEVITDLNKVRELLETPEEKPTGIEEQNSFDETHKPITEWAEEITEAEYKEATDVIEIQPMIAEKTKEDLAKEYIEKFGKKPFAWWDKEVLQSKLS